ncbi:hypothetical protein BH11GEM2_BH11GEM2_38990 [soil metagenome]
MKLFFLDVRLSPDVMKGGEFHRVDILGVIRNGQSTTRHAHRTERAAWRGMRHADEEEGGERDSRAANLSTPTRV